MENRGVEMHNVIGIVSQDLAITGMVALPRKPMRYGVHFIGRAAPNSNESQVDWH